ncbi:MAG: hypothetical protein AAGE52_02195 [Myxococcota bacterium]
MSEAIEPAPSTPEEDGWEELLKVVDRIPFVSGLKRDVARLGRLVVRRRAPRIAVLGAQGSGRSQLANALLGVPVLAVGPPTQGSSTQGRWVEIDAGGRRLDWLELDVGPKTEDAFHAAGRTPDLLVLVVTPEEVEQGLGLHLEAATALRSAQPDLPLVSVLTQIDTLEPSTAAAPYPTEKEIAVDAARKGLAQQLREASLPKTHFAIATSSPSEQRLAIEPVGIEALAEALAAALPEAARVEGARALVDARKARRRVGTDVVRSCSSLAVTVAITPLPLSDIAVLAPLQGMMVTTLAYLSGRGWDTKTAGEWIASVGVVGSAGLGLRWGAQQIVKLVPGMGSIASAGIAGAGTLALGRSALRYFLQDELEPEDAAG